MASQKQTAILEILRIGREVLGRPLRGSEIAEKLLDSGVCHWNPCYNTRETNIAVIQAGLTGSSGTLNRLVSRGEVVRISRGQYQLPDF